MFKTIKTKKRDGIQDHTCLLCGYAIKRRQGMFVSKSWLKGIGFRFKDSNKRIKRALVHNMCYHDLKKIERALKNLNNTTFNIVIENRKITSP